MKKKLLTVALFLALSSTAFAEGMYAAIDVGQSAIKDACVGATAFGMTCTETGTAIRIGGGYQFNQNFGIEANYGFLGSAKASGGGGSGEIKPSSLQIAATGTLPLGDAFSIIGKLGIANNSAKFTSTGSADQTSSSSKLAYGIGAQYDFSKSLGVRAQYESLGDVLDNTGTADTNYKVSLISAGLIFKF